MHHSIFGDLDYTDIESTDEVESIAGKDAESDLSTKPKTKSASVNEAGKEILEESDKDGKMDSQNEQSNQNQSQSNQKRKMKTFECKGCGKELTKTKLKNHLMKVDICNKEYEEDEIEALKQPIKRDRKEYQKQYQKQYQEKNYEKTKAKKKEYYRKNKEEKKECYQKNREEKIKQSADYYQKNREEKN